MALKKSNSLPVTDNKIISRVHFFHMPSGYGMDINIPIPYLQNIKKISFLQKPGPIIPLREWMWMGTKLIQALNLKQRILLLPE